MRRCGPLCGVAMCLAARCEPLCSVAMCLRHVAGHTVSRDRPSHAVPPSSLLCHPERSEERAQPKDPLGMYNSCLLNG